jgi:hypothetical protein
MEELDAFCHILFRDKEELPKKYTTILQLKPKEEFPRKQQLLVEELITANGAKHFLEITGGMLSKLNGTGEMHFEVFEPSEALASEDVLSLEEKFLAGEGQNITPARFAKGGKGETIRWCSARSPFGWIVVGSTQRGLAPVFEKAARDSSKRLIKKATEPDGDRVRFRSEPPISEPSDSGP